MLFLLALCFTFGKKEKTLRNILSALTFILLFLNVNFSAAQHIKATRATVQNNEIILFADGTWQYVNTRLIDSSKKILGTKIPGSSPICTDVFCDHPDSLTSYFFIEPFDRNDCMKDIYGYLLKKETYKEVSTDSFSQNRIQINQIAVPNLLSGVSASVIPINNDSSLYLVKVYHQNGLESWYYPLQTLSVKPGAIKQGTQIGQSTGKYFWQLRFHNHSIDPAILFGKNLPEREGLILEQKNLIDLNRTKRKEGFLQNCKRILPNEMMNKIN